VDLHVSKCMLACYLSLQPETLSRIMRQLSEEGILQIAGARVRVNDVERLRDLSGPCDCAEGPPADRRLPLDPDQGARGIPRKE
jgi:hypothetical protein